MDACDNVMEKIGLPKGLIRYDTESKKRINLLRPRTLWYAGIISLVGCFMLYSLLTRSPQELSVIHDRNPLFVKLSDGSIRNGYNITILNKSHEDKVFSLHVKGIEGAALRVQGSSDIPADSLPVFADNVGHFRVFVTAPAQHEAREEIEFRIEENESKLASETGTIFVSKSK